MRTIAVGTVARSDFGIYRPILQRIKEDPELRLQLIVAGMHLSPEYGATCKSIEEEGFEISERIEMLVSSDSPEGVAKSMGLGTISCAQVFARKRPDIFVVLGDRFEMHSLALAALPFNIPVAHIHGGELSYGAIDDSLRHSITKLSHLHFVTTRTYADRVIQLGEEPWRVTVSGAPSLDNLRSMKLMSRVQLQRRFGVPDRDPLLLVTFHPITVGYEQAEFQLEQLLTALRTLDLPTVLTMPNADTKGRAFIRQINDFVKSTSNAVKVDNFGTKGYFSVMAAAKAMVGNSSSGIIEAASFELPVVNIGRRQAGRIHGPNVNDVDNDAESISTGIERALDAGFRAELEGMTNPYDAGESAADVIVQKLKLALDHPRLLDKTFNDLPAPEHRATE